MTVESCRLVDGGDELALLPSDRFDLTKIDLGFPEVREVTDPRPHADGVADRTAFHGSRGVTVSGEAWGDDAAPPVVAVDALRRFLRPGGRPLLVFRMVGQQERQIQLRVDGSSAPITHESGAMLAFQVSWRAPDGRIYAAAEKVRTVNPGAEGETGRTYDLTYSRSYPFSGGPGSRAVTNDGTTVTEPVLRIFGPCTDPVVINDTVGKRLAFVGLSIAGGEYVEVDVANRTVRSNGLTDAGFNRYRYLDFVASEWWGIEPGRNVLRFQATTWTTPAQVEVTYRDAWL